MQRCKNHELCKNEAVPEVGQGFCMCCGSWCKFGHGWDELEFINTTEENKECSVCSNNCDRKLMFPTNCGHSFCISCSKDLLLWDETRHHLSPVPYGCPPCPNGCINPVRGRQCYCEEYDSVQEQWKRERLVEYNRWNDEEHDSIETDDGSSYAKMSCPLCRSKYVRRPFVSGHYEFYSNDHPDGMVVLGSET